MIFILTKNKNVINMLLLVAFSERARELRYYCNNDKNCLKKYIKTKSIIKHLLFINNHI